MKIRKLSNRGSSLLGVLFIGTLLLIVSVALLQSSQQREKSIKIASDRMTLDKLSSKISRSTRSLSVMRSSVDLSATMAAGDPRLNLALCVQTSGATDCTVSTVANFKNEITTCMDAPAGTAGCRDLSQLEFALWVQSTGTLLAGTRTAPARYRANGEFCEPGEVASSKCPLEAYAFFQPDCAACDATNKVEVITVIRPYPGFVPNGKELKLNARISDPIKIESTRIMNLVTTCPVDQVFVGMDADENAICEPQQAACPSNYFVDRVDFATKTFHCERMRFTDCGAGNYVQSIAPDGTPTCVAFPTFSAISGCPVGEAQYGNASNGTPLCSNFKTMVNTAMAPIGIRRCRHPDQDIYLSENQSSCENIYTPPETDQGFVFKAPSKTW